MRINPDELRIDVLNRYEVQNGEKANFALTEMCLFTWKPHLLRAETHKQLHATIHSETDLMARELSLRTRLEILKLRKAFLFEVRRLLIAQQKDAANDRNEMDTAARPFSNDSSEKSHNQECDNNTIVTPPPDWNGRL